jgi:hypothetical protein
VPRWSAFPGSNRFNIGNSRVKLRAREVSGLDKDGIEGFSGFLLDVESPLELFLGDVPPRLQEDPDAVVRLGRFRGPKLAVNEKEPSKLIPPGDDEGSRRTFPKDPAQDG